MKKNRLLGVLTPIFILIIYFPLLINRSLAWGDAPYFLGEGFDLLPRFQLWSENTSALGSPNNLLWISPIMYLYKALHNAMSVQNDTILRTLFYFPSIIFGFSGMYFLSRSFKFSSETSLVLAFFFIANTYFLLLVDGGQVGVALAYSIAPFIFASLKNYHEKPSLRTMLISMVAITLGTMTDPRILLISLAAFYLWHFFSLWLNNKSFSLENSTRVITIALFTIATSMYWLYPLLRTSPPEINSDISSLKITSLLNALFLYQPHWPNNIFGETSYPKFYFVGLPLLLLLPLMKGKKDKILPPLFGFLVFSFLLKGTSPPMGDFYNFLLQLPLGTAFRDSSKFFVPVILFASIILGNSLKNIRFKHKHTIALIYLFVLVHGSWGGRLNFVLSNNNHAPWVRELNHLIEQEQEFGRNIWIPDAHPEAFMSPKHPKVNGEEMVSLRPLARINAGSSNKFNYLNKPQTIEWYELFGISHIIVDSSRNWSKNQEEKQELTDTLKNLRTNKNMLTLNNLPQVWSVPKLYVIVGSDNIYDQLFEQGLPLANQALAFVEDGMFNPHQISNLNPQSVTIVFNNTNEKDFTTSFLQKYFISVNETPDNQWAVYTSQEYLTWKYQLLIRDLKLESFDYNRGIAFSSNEGEEMKFNINLKEGGEYKLLIRALAKNRRLLAKINDTEYSADFESDKFSWHTKDIKLEPGDHTVQIENISELSALNTLALVPKSEWENAKAEAADILDTYQILEMQKALLEMGNLQWKEVDYQRINQSEFEITQHPQNYWIVVSNTYHPSWKTESQQAIALYSSINGFYVEPKDSEKIYFSDKHLLSTGIRLTAIGTPSIIVFGVIFEKCRKYV